MLLIKFVFQNYYILAVLIWGYCVRALNAQRNKTFLLSIGTQDPLNHCGACKNSEKLKNKTATLIPVLELSNTYFLWKETGLREIDEAMDSMLKGEIIDKNVVHSFNQKTDFNLLNIVY